MADVEKVQEVLGQQNLTNGTGRPPATPEGMAVAYGSLVIMALLPIFFGAFRSVKHHKEQKVAYEVSHMFPSCMKFNETVRLPV